MSQPIDRCLNCEIRQRGFLSSHCTDCQQVLVDEGTFFHVTALTVNRSIPVHHDNDEGPFEESSEEEESTPVRTIIHVAIRGQTHTFTRYLASEQQVVSQSEQPAEIMSTTLYIEDPLVESSVESMDNADEQSFQLNDEQKEESSHCDKNSETWTQLIISQIIGIRSPTRFCFTIFH